MMHIRTAALNTSTRPYLCEQALSTADLQLLVIATGRHLVIATGRQLTGVPCDVQGSSSPPVSARPTSLSQYNRHSSSPARSGLARHAPAAAYNAWEKVPEAPCTPLAGNNDSHPPTASGEWDAQPRCKTLRMSPAELEWAVFSWGCPIAACWADDVDDGNWGFDASCLPSVYQDFY